MTPALAEACARAVHVVRSDGTVLRAGRATLFVLERLGWGVLARVLAVPPFVWCVEVGYRVVARNRAFFSRLFRDPRTDCRR
jgi:predicted DCC family thiol-disulfide oxidoreductase YuxK